MAGPIAGGVLIAGATLGLWTRCATLAPMLVSTAQLLWLWLLAPTVDTTTLADNIIVTAMACVGSLGGRACATMLRTRDRVEHRRHCARAVSATWTFGAAALGGVYTLACSIVAGAAGVLSAAAIAAFVSAAFHMSAYGAMRRRKYRQGFLRSKRHTRRFLLASAGLQLLGITVSVPFDIAGNGALFTALRFSVACVCAGAACAWAIATTRHAAPTVVRTSDICDTPPHTDAGSGDDVSGADTDTGDSTSDPWECTSVDVEYHTMTPSATSSSSSPY